MSLDQYIAPSKHVDESTLNISSASKKQIAAYLSEIETFTSVSLMQLIQNHIWCTPDYPHKDCLKFHTVIAHFSEFQEKFKKYSTNESETARVIYITKCMAFALRWNQILFYNNSQSGKSLKASLSSRIDQLEKLLQEIDASE